LFYNNVIRNHLPDNCGGELGGQGLVLNYSARNTKVFNNTIYNNAAGGIILGSTASDAIIQNNISRNNGGVGNYQDGGNRTVQNNNIFNNASDPGFVNPAQSNVNNADGFKLSSGSGPAFNTGLDVASYFNSTNFPISPRDFSGTPRPQAGAYDIGAFE
jgi:parallel beta-helix repeat protein